MLDAAEEDRDLHKHPEVTLRKFEKPLDLEDSVNGVVKGLITG